MIYILSSIFLISVNISWGLEIVQQNQRYYIKGACEEASNEVKFFSTRAPSCSCENSGCLTELTSHLPTRIQYMLKQGQMQKDGPNCWNSILFALGLHQGLHFSTGEIKFWLSSPFCKEVKGKPSPGDLINVTGFAPENGNIEEWHTYQLLSPNLAFNKSSPNKDDPYEITGAYDYFKRGENQPDEVPEKCRFVGLAEAKQKQCKFTARAFRCEAMDSVLKLQGNLQSDSAKKKLAELGHCSEQAVLLGKDYPFKEMSDLSKGLEHLAFQELHVPDFESSPREMKQLIERYRRENCRSCDEDALDPIDSIIPMIYLFAHPEMNLDSFSPATKDLILKARELKLYSNLNEKDRFIWINILLTGRSLKEQFNWLSNPENY